ncbi:Uncharacterised protein [Vibrio cholerae]|nr:Uncharacterised protein [Vibrio cholerae]
MSVGYTKIITIHINKRVHFLFTHNKERLP